MIGPSICPWIEEAEELTGGCGERGDIGSLESIARKTSSREILGYSWTAVLLGNDVLHLAPEVSVVAMNQAVFANAIRPLEDQAPKSDGDVAAHVVDARGPVLSPAP